MKTADEVADEDAEAASSRLLMEDARDTLLLPLHDEEYLDLSTLLALINMEEHEKFKSNLYYQHTNKYFYRFVEKELKKKN